MSGNNPATTKAANVEQQRFKKYPFIHEALFILFLVEVVGTVYVLNLDSLVPTFTLFSVGVMVAIHTIKWLGRYIALHFGTKSAISKRENVRKFADQFWQFAIHAGMTTAVIHVFRDLDMMYTDSSFWVDTSKYYAIEPLRMEDQRYAKIKYFYLIQLAIWIYTCFSHIFIEARHKDYYVMLVHHVATIFLVLGSFYSGYLCTGAVIMYIHDCSDISVDLLKVFKSFLDDSLIGVFVLCRCLITLSTTGRPCACHLQNFCLYRTCLFGFFSGCTPSQSTSFIRSALLFNHFISDSVFSATYFL